MGDSLGRPVLSSLGLVLALLSGFGALVPVAGLNLGVGLAPVFLGAGVAFLAGWVLVLLGVSRNERGVVLQMLALIVLWAQIPFWPFVVMAMLIMGGPWPSL